MTTRLVVLLNELEDIHILSLDASCGVNHQDADIRVLDGTDRAHHTVELEVFRHLVLTTDAGSIDEIEVEAELVVFGVDAVSGSAGNIGYDVAVFADEGIDDARLTGIGATHDGEARGVVVDVRNIGNRQLLQDVVQQVAGATACSSADTEGIAESQLIELILSVEVFAVVGLVGYEHHGQLGSAQYLCHVLVEIGEAVLNVHQKQHKVGFLSGHDDLLANLLFEDVVAIDDPSASINYRELPAVPFTLAILAVTGSASLVAHNGATAVRQSVKQGGLADIRASYDCY